MKHPTPSAPSSPAIADALSEAGVPVSPKAADLLYRHAVMVLEANQRFNLTRITDEDALLRLHIVDSLVPWGHIVLQHPTVDIGSGGGFPGIPLAIVHGGPVLLCESVGKKSTFLTECVRELDLEAEVFPGRAEDLATRGGFASTVTARAVSALASLVELAAPLLAQSGRLVALKGAPSPQELLAGDKAAALCGMERLEIWEYALPRGDERRCAVVYERVGGSQLKLPRRAGLAQNRPLAE